METENAYLSFRSTSDDNICVMGVEGSDCLRLEISYTDLVPLLIWVESGATSAYTAFDPSGFEESDFLQKAGFAATHDGEGYAAIEFVGTRFESILDYIDFCHGCLEPSDPSLVTAHNSKLGEDPAWSQMHSDGDFADESSYINTDVDSVFKMRVSGDRIILSGVPARYYWSGLKDSELRKMRRVHLFREATSVEARDEAHRAALWFFQTAALLRYFKGNDPSRWQQFVRDVKVGYYSDPAPWNLYAETFQKVYGRSPLETVN